MNEITAAYGELVTVLKKIDADGSTAATDKEAQDAVKRIKELKEKLAEATKGDSEGKSDIMKKFSETEDSQKYLDTISEATRLYTELSAAKKSSPALDLAIAELNRSKSTD